jgi:Caspase domain
MRRAIFSIPVLILTLLAWMPSSCAEKRVALVIGNSTYQHVPALLNPANDAQDIAAALKAVGFDVIEAHDLNQTDMLATVRRFSEAADLNALLRCLEYEEEVQRKLGNKFTPTATGSWLDWVR